MQKASKIGCVVLLGLLFASLAAVVYAQVQVSVSIRNPLYSSSGAKGIVSSGYWVGEIPITVSGDSEPAQQTNAYCMNVTKTVYVGSTYEAALAAVTGSAKWSAVSYVLTWYNPPADDDAAAVNQVAIWRLLDDKYVRPYWLDTGIDDEGKALAAFAKDKDVVREGDVFEWIEPVTINESAVMGNPGETVTFKAKLTNEFGKPKAGVKIIFNATLSPADVELDAANVYPAVTHTDSDGIAEVTVKVPDDIKNGERVAVTASTKSVWPQLYMDLYGDERQDLIGIGTTFELTVSTNVCVLAYIMVIPEVPLGTLTAGAACALGFVFWKKGGHLKKQKLN